MGLFDTIKAKLGLGDTSNEAQHKADAPPADATRSSAEGITLGERPTASASSTLVMRPFFCNSCRMRMSIRSSFTMHPLFRVSRV